jgi:hypothetical protein
MSHHSFRATAWATALAAVSAFSLIDPPTAGERALLGRASALEAGSSNLRMARAAGRISPGRALLGAGLEELGGGEAIQLRPRNPDGPRALLGTP